MATPDELDGGPDTVRIRIGDDEMKRIVESYEIKASVLQQPAAFALRLGSSEVAVDLFDKAKPGTPFEIWVGPRKLLTGRIDSRGVPTASSTTIEVRGRDYLADLLGAYVEEEQSFTQKTYFELTRKVLDLAGLTEAKGHYLRATNDANRRLLTGTKVRARSDAKLSTELATDAMAGTGNLVFQTPKTKLGERYYDFLVRQYQLAGLFLWASPDKSFVLAAPNARQAPTYSIFRARADRGAADENSNVLDCRYNDDTTMRHAKVTVFGRSGGGRGGIVTCSGFFEDPEMVAYGLDKQMFVHDADVKNMQQCEFVARRMVAEARRAGWQLEYTVAGHMIFSGDADDLTATWGPDTIVQVEDEELGISGPFYLEACTYSRSSNGTSTHLVLMKPSDLLFATGLDGVDGVIVQRKLRVPKGKTVR